MEAKVEKTPEPSQPVQPIMVSDLLNQQEEKAEENTSTDVVVHEEKAPEVIPQGKSFTLDVSRKRFKCLQKLSQKRLVMILLTLIW